uniref:Uncharacterized protein n=1 Tax=Anas platyrhynchos TaxID=8839 RepID=A0A8B9R465_ANAPL
MASAVFDVKTWEQPGGESREIKKKKLEEFLNFKQLKTSLKEAILLDYYIARFWWAKEENFSLVQLSGFMDLLNFVLESLHDKHMTLGDNIKELGKAMAGTGETIQKEVKTSMVTWMSSALSNPREELVISNKYVMQLAPPAVTPFPPLLEEGYKGWIAYLREYLRNRIFYSLQLCICFSLSKMLGFVSLHPHIYGDNGKHLQA